MKLLDDQASNQKLLDAIEVLKAETIKSRDMGARLFTVLSNGDDGLIEKFKAGIQPMSSAFPNTHKIIVDAVDIVYASAKQHENVRSHLGGIAASLAKANVEINFGL